MDRKKPSLTSPGKVGFLVALLMVVTALGVSYWITGTFGVTWHWIHTGGLSPATWSFNFGAFVEEMAPLLALTSMLAFAAFVLVSGAVRRYKAYLDSGVDYKHLLKSIKSIEDLEDEGVAERLKQHPELREFLLGIKHRVAAHGRQNGEHDGRPNTRTPGESRAVANEARPRLQSEAALLSSAIAGGRDGFPNELVLTVPELKQIERALRGLFANLGEETVVESPAPDGAEALRASLRPPVAALRRDIEACANGAREMESALGALFAGLEGGSKPATAANADDLKKRVDATAQALAALGEETRRIAIGAALQATGGPEADSIKVADELRTLATRFNAVAQHWRQTAPGLKEMLGASASPGPNRPDASVAAATAVTRARLWSERTVAINEHVRALERVIQTNGDEPAPAPVSATPSFVDTAIEKTPVAPAPGPEPPAEQVEEFLSRGSAEMFGSANDAEVAFADIPGFEKESRFFADDSGSTRAEMNDDNFVVDNGKDKRWDLDSEVVEAVSAEKSATAEPVRPAAPDSDGFLTGPRPVVSPQKVQKPRPSSVPRFTTSDTAVEVPAATATLEPDTDAIDLYELGAIDCVQTA